MSKGSRPAVCSVTGKRLRAKLWFYRDGQYFYNKQVWLEEREKLAADAAKAKAAAEENAKAAQAKAQAEAAKPAGERQAPEATQKDAKPAAS
jgi:hypothetical protein